VLDESRRAGRDQTESGAGLPGAPQQQPRLERFFSGTKSVSSDPERALIPLVTLLIVAARSAATIMPTNPAGNCVATK
jgi:hypothetical protein